MRVFKLRIDPDTYSRENAVIVYKNKIFYDVNHQYAFELALNDEGKSIKSDIYKMEAIVDEANKNGLISTWHWFWDGEQHYLVCNFRNDFLRHYKLKSVQDFVRKNNMQLGYFMDDSQEQFVLLK